MGNPVMGNFMDTQITFSPEAPAHKGGWHQTACEMRQNGASYSEIARIFGVSITAAYFAVNPGKRQSGKKKKKAPEA